MPVMPTVLQWEIYDAYIADQEKQRLQEEVNKQKAAAKKATAAVEAAETSQDTAKVCITCAEAVSLQKIKVCSLQRATHALYNLSCGFLECKHQDSSFQFLCWVPVT